jgi:ABC-type branched-subunit amino acid transport system ATPase component
VKAVDGLDMEVSRGEIVALIGPNGAGKTTLFNIITGFLRADSGRVEAGGKDITHWHPYRLVEVGVARTFQDLRLIGAVSALANVQLAFPRQLGESLVKGLSLSPRAVASQERGNRDAALAILQEIGLGDKASDLAAHLSYGQQKLLSLACVLATSAEILLLDEPVAGVHPDLIEVILEKIRSLSRAGKTVVLIEHNISAVEKVADRVVFMDAGSKVTEGTPDEVLSYEHVLEAYLD